MTPNPNPSPELKPCPFCECHANVNWHGEIEAWTGNAYAQCFGCGAMTGVCDSPEAAIAAWNTRALSPQPLPAPGEVEPWTPDRFTLTERELDDECGCPEETWDTPFGVLHMHLSAGKPSNACLDNGDEGEWHIDLTATTTADARSAFFAWSMFAATLTPTLATVAAANDEAFARGVQAAAKVTDHRVELCRDLAWQARFAVFEALPVAIRLLPQGGGK